MVHLESADRPSSITSTDGLYTVAEVVLRLSAMAICLFCSATCAAPWIVSVDQQQGLPFISKGGANALRSAFVFWGADWAWADQQVEFKIFAPFEYSVSGKNQVLNLDLSGRIRKPSVRQLVWEFDLNARDAKSGVIGGGIAFMFDLTNFGSEFGEPKLLSNNRGWTWGRAGGTRFEMRFDPPLATVYFERGQKSEIRAFFYRDQIPQGAKQYLATLTLSGATEIFSTAAERFGLDDHAKWPADILDWKTSPVDLSFLNAVDRPAGKRGFVKVVNDRLVFEDGTPARFWGTNITAYALFGTSQENVKLQSRRLSELGFNLVRFHHHDSDWVTPNIFGDGRNRYTGNLDPAMLEKVDWWIKCLKDEGIYVWLDLHVGRQLRIGDHVEAFEEIARGKPTAELKGYNYVNPSIQQAMKRFNEAYVNRVNAFTSKRYKDEPAIAAMLITNENDITHHFGNALLPDKKVPRHNALYMAQAEAFAARHGLPKEKVWRSWEHGPSKLFLNDLEQRFNADMIAHLRALGVRTPIATTSAWGYNPLSSLPALSVGSVIDAHSYGGIGELEKNPIYAPNLMHWIAAAQVTGMPLMVTEWNVESFPSPDRHGIPLYIAASGSHQGVAALVQYAYSQVPLNGPGSVSNWHAFNDPAMIAMLPAAALMYRQGHVREATSTYVFTFSKEQFFGQSISPATSIALRTAAEIGKLAIAFPQTKELPWLKRGVTAANGRMVTDPKQSLISLDAVEASSDTGELRRNWDQGIYIVNTSRSQAATGWIGGKQLSLPDVDIEVSTRNASVAVQSLDANPIAEADTILISLGARSIARTAKRLPFHSEPVEGELRIRARKGLKLYRHGGLAQAAAILPTRYHGGRYVIKLERDLGSYWLVLK